MRIQNAFAVLRVMPMGVLPGEDWSRVRGRRARTRRWMVIAKGRIR